MKPLALHLVVILFVGSQLLGTVVLQTPMTTGQPPSLPSPQRSQLTTMMTPSSLTSSIKLMAITTSTLPNSTASSNSGSIITDTNNNSNQRSMAHDHSTPPPDDDASDEDSTPPSSSSSPSVNGRNVATATMAIESTRGGRSIGSGGSSSSNIPRDSPQQQRRQFHPQYRSPSAASSASSSSSSSIQQMQQLHRHQFQRQSSESSTSQPVVAVHRLQTVKTPRMIHRLVGGHIQNSQSVSDKVLTTSKPSTQSLINKRTPLHISSSYRTPKIGLSQPIATTTRKPNAESVEANDREDFDDAAYLDDPGDFGNWDNGILRLSAGSGKETSTKGKKKDESKKTLSDQVRDGKYGLIEKELFRREPQRPGVLSYLPNKEVPIDNERNYGGLNEEDIWLAEDHLLVIKGGSLNEPDPAEPWPPLDDYDAPGRQIKIPPNPKVPPPFPVQLEENGPIQFIGNSKVSIVYPIANESISLYSTGTESQNEASEVDDTNQKNLLTRPGTSGGSEKGQNDPSYFYPKPYPSWLFQNQTFVNPFLGARPLPFAGIGPFTNGSLEAFNGTDFDEDDPSLYYPPPYSFVYKSNYSNPVPPGPLVPGIVLPPPPDAFARLEKPRNRFPSYSTTTTTEVPFREILTKISEYTPKTVVVSTQKPTRPPPQLTTSPKLQPVPVQQEVYYSAPTPNPSKLQPVPVQHEIYYSAPSPPSSAPTRVYSTQNSVSFVPTTSRKPTGNAPTLSKSNPIYYEYYEARKEPPSTTQSYVPEFIPKPSTAQQRPQHKHSKNHNKPKTNNNPQYYYTTTTTSRPPTKQQQQQYIPTSRPQFVYEDYVYITPKPEIRPNGISNTNRNYVPYQPPVKVPPLKSNLPYESFEREVNAIREKLQFYQSQHLQDNSIPRTPKSKSEYDFNFNTAKPTNRNFNPPAEYDAEPFKPMVPYSPPVDDANSFRAIAFEKVDNDLSSVQGYYDTSTTVEPPPVRQQKKIRVGAKYLQPLITPYDQEQPISGRPIEYNSVSTPRTVLTTAKPWITVEKQVVQEVPAPQKSARLQVASNRGFQGQFPGYYYNPPMRQNNRYYEEPFYQQPPPTRKVINNRPMRPQKPQQQQVWSLENDTYVNYAPNRPPLNPEAEFINPYQPFNQYSKPQYSQSQRLPPAIQNQSPYFPPPPSRLPNRQQQVSLHRDTLVNYRQPLPPINPDSEYISIPSRNQQPQQQQQQQQLQQLPLPSYHSPVQYRDPQQNGNAYFITPNYRRYNGGGGVAAGADH
ncbi:uncharacterized protein LOC129944114 [Eupeodes corollae]|uniref:uncharacterized protein LOC129944114 n=1 Tax=Eupeodes corollae TaxID=290404 RepID=UPI002490401C|nr:uncharacterized protein LOC129944114 [Eupeodes corollae]XP_055909281.1 uncharacterized protein LOC129944114 [Eupeodes corollae]